jgi:hypothetical protein
MAMGIFKGAKNAMQTLCGSAQGANSCMMAD